MITRPRWFWMLALLVCLFPLLCRSERLDTNKLTPAQRGRLNRAEKLANRFERRLQQTRDFRVLWDEFLIPDAIVFYRKHVSDDLRYCDSSGITFSEDLMRTLDERSARAKLVSEANLFYVVPVAAMWPLIEAGRFDEDTPDNILEHMPSQLRAAADKTKYVGAWLRDESFEIKTRDELAVFLSEAESFTATARAYVPRDWYRKLLKKRGLPRQEDPDGKGTFYAAGEDSPEEYRFMREGVSLLVGERNGRMKVLAISHYDP